MEQEFVCRHLMLTKDDLIKVIKEKGIRTMLELQNETDVATICGSCFDAVEEILEENK